MWVVSEAGNKVYYLRIILGLSCRSMKGSGDQKIIKKFIELIVKISGLLYTTHYFGLHNPSPIAKEGSWAGGGGLGVAPRPKIRQHFQV